MLNRRDFLTASTGLVAAGLTAPAWANTTPARVRFAPERGFFELTVGTAIADQLEFAAAVGFDAFLDSALLQQSNEEAHATVAAAKSSGVTLGPALGPAMTSDLLCSTSWLSVADLTCARAHQLGLTAVRFDVGPAVTRLLLSHSPAVPGLLRRLAEVVRSHQVAAILEPWDDGRLGRSAYVAWSNWVSAAASPQLGLTADSLRLASAGIEVAQWLRTHRDIIRHVELADSPATPGVPAARIPWSLVAAALDEPQHEIFVGLRYAGSDVGAQPSTVHAERRA